MTVLTGPVIEWVFSSHDDTFVARVPGGILVKSYNHGGVSMVFVPMPTWIADDYCTGGDKWKNWN